VSSPCLTGAQLAIPRDLKASAQEKCATGKSILPIGQGSQLQVPHWQKKYNKQDRHGNIVRKQRFGNEENVQATGPLRGFKRNGSLPQPLRRLLIRFGVSAAQNRKRHDRGIMRRYPAGRARTSGDSTGQGAGHSVQTSITTPYVLAACTKVGRRHRGGRRPQTYQRVDDVCPRRGRAR